MSTLTNDAAAASLYNLIKRMSKQIGTDQGVEAAIVAVANIIVNATKVMDLCSGDIKMDDVRWTVTPLAG